MIRYVFSISCAIVIGLFLFWFMHILITGSGQQVRKADVPGGVDFVRLQRDENLETRQRRLPQKPPPPEQPPPPPRLAVAEVEKPRPQPPRMDIPRLDLPVDIGSGPFLGRYAPGERVADGELIPLLRIAPQYPRSAARDGIEGWVKLEFTINADGTVSDPSIVESQPRRVFDAAARRAILKWKFKPRIVGGEPVAHRGVQTIEFRMSAP